MLSPFLNIDGSPLSDPVLGHGGTGVVVRRDGTAVKLPLKHIGHDDEDTRANCEVIEREKRYPPTTTWLRRCCTLL